MGADSQEPATPTSPNEGGDQQSPNPDGATIRSPETNLDRLASKAYPPRTTPQFKTFGVDVVGSLLDAADKAAAARKDVRWRDGDPVVDRQGSTQQDDRQNGEPSKQITDSDKARDIADASNDTRTKESYYSRLAEIRRQEEDGEISWHDSVGMQQALRAEYNADKFANVNDDLNTEAGSLSNQAKEHGKKAEITENWTEVLLDHPELASNGWNVYQLISEEQQAERARIDADSSSERANEVARQLERGETNLLDIIRELGSGRIFGDRIERVLRAKLSELFSGDKGTTIADIEKSFLLEVAKVSEAYEVSAILHEARVAGLAKGEMPEHKRVI